MLPDNGFLSFSPTPRLSKWVPVPFQWSWLIGTFPLSPVWFRRKLGSGGQYVRYGTNIIVMSTLETRGTYLTLVSLHKVLGKRGDGTSVLTSTRVRTSGPVRSPRRIDHLGPLIQEQVPYTHHRCVRWRTRPGHLWSHLRRCVGK